MPNLEVRSLYIQIIETWLANGHGLREYNKFINAFLEGNMEVFENYLRDIMEQTVSYHDLAHKPEEFYHGFMLGITTSIYGNKNYEIKSNRESGYGRYDYMVLSHDDKKPTIILEIKRSKSTRKK